MKHHVVPCGACDSSDNFWHGTHRSTIISWYQQLLHHKAVLSSPKEQGEREDPQPSFAAVGWTDCPGSSRKKHQMTGQRVCHILT